MQWKWNSELIGIIGAEQVGKSHFFKHFLLPKIPKNRLIVLDTNYEYQKYGAQVVIPKEYNARWLDGFLKNIRAKSSNICLVFEDLDIYLADGKRSEELMKLGINGAHQNIGGVWFSHRALGIPKVFLMRTRFLILFAGLSPEDALYLGQIAPCITPEVLPSEPRKAVLTDKSKIWKFTTG